MLQQEMAQRTIVVRMWQRRVLMWLLRLRIGLGVMMVMFTTGVRMLRRFCRRRTRRVIVPRRMFVRVDDGGSGRHQQRTRRQPAHQASSQPVQHDLHSSNLWRTRLTKTVTDEPERASVRFPSLTNRTLARSG